LPCDRYKCTSDNSPELSEEGWCSELNPGFPRPPPKNTAPTQRAAWHSWVPEKRATESSSNIHLKKSKGLFCSGGTFYLNPAIVVELVHPPPSPMSKFLWKGG